MEFRNTAPLAWIRMTWYVVNSQYPKGPSSHLQKEFLMEFPLYPVTEPKTKLRPALAGGSRISLPKWWLLLSCRLREGLEASL